MAIHNARDSSMILFLIFKLDATSVPSGRSLLEGMTLVPAQRGV